MPSLYGGWPIRGGCVNSKQSSAELCMGSILLGLLGLLEPNMQNIPILAIEDCVKMSKCVCIKKKYNLHFESQKRAGVFTNMYSW